MSAAEEVEDFLDVDTDIPGQKFAVLSFLSPENVLKKKEAYFFSEFMKWVCDQSEFLDHVVLKGDKTKLNYNALKDKYDDFIYAKDEELEAKFHEMENFRTTVRGVKVRGVYATQREAEVRAKVLQRLYKRDNIFVGPVGYWLPWDPNPDKVENVEYLEPELNNLMKLYKQNAAKRDIHYAEVKEEMMNRKLTEKKEGEAPNQVSEETKKAVFEEEDPWMKRKMEEQEKRDE